MAFRWKSIPSMETSRLVLRALGADEAEDLLQIYGDPEVMRYEADPIFPETSYVHRMLADVARRFAIRDALEWGVELKETGLVVGICGLHSFDEARSHAEVGCLLARSYWGNGIMSEALQSLIGFATEELRLSSLFADIDASNLRSMKLFKGLGFLACGPNTFEKVLKTSRNFE